MSAPQSTSLDGFTDKHRAALTGIYERIVRGIPFSTIAQVYESLQDGPSDSRLGRSCVGQSLELGRLLLEHGLGEVTYVRAARHAAVRCSTDEHAYLLDPFLLHLEPLDIQTIVARRRLEVPAYPLVDPRGSEHHMGRLALRYYRSGVLVLASYAYARSAGARQLRRHFKLVLEPLDERPIPPAKELTPLLFHPEQTTLSLRVVTAGARLLELIYPIALHHHSGPIEENQLLLRVDDDELVEYEDRENFEVLLGALCVELEASRRELVEHVLGGVQLYERHAPPDMVYAAAPPLDAQA